MSVETPQAKNRSARWIMRGFKEMKRRIDKADLTPEKRAKAIECYVKLAYLMLNGEWLEQIKVEVKPT